MAFDITGQLNLRLASGAVRNIANEINSQLRGTGVSGVNVPVRVDLNSLRAMRESLHGLSTATEKFAQQSGLAFKRFTAFSVAALPFIQVASGIRSAITQAVNFDREMVRLKQVTVEAGSEVGQIANEVTRLSTTFGVSSAELMKTAVTLKQANLSIGETRDVLQALAKSALAPNFDSMAQTAEGAIAVLNQFKVSSKEAETAIGSMNAVAGEFAVEAADLIETVRRTGGAFKATGGDLNQLLALFTSVRQTTRESAESIATGLRTIFTRIQRNDTVNALKEFGVNLRFTREEAAKAGNLNLANQFVGGYEAIMRLSRALTQLPQTDPRFSAIVEDLGGYRQISKVIPLIQEAAISEKALMVAEAGRVSLTVNAAQAADSYANRLTKLQESYLAFGRSLMDTSAFKGAFTAFEALANSFLMVMNAAKPLLPLLSVIATAKVLQGGGNFVANFVRGASYSGTGNLINHKAQGGVIHMSNGGLVPGIGNTDSVPALLPVGAFVVRKSSVRSFGKDNLMKMSSGGSVPAMVMPGEYIFSPNDARRIGSEKLRYLNHTGRLPAYASGGLIDPKLEAAAQAVMDNAQNPNTNKDFRKYLKALEAAAVSRGDLGNLTSFLPKVKGRGVLQYGVSSRPDALGFMFANKPANTAYVTNQHIKKGNSVETALHEILHVVDLQAGRKLTNSSDTTPAFLSTAAGTKTNDLIKKIQPIMLKAYSQFSQQTRDYMSMPEEILAQAFELHNLKDPKQNGYFNQTSKYLNKKEQDELLQHYSKLTSVFRTEAQDVLNKNGSNSPQPPNPNSPQPPNQPSPRSRRPYDQFKPGDDWRKTIRTALKTGNQVGAYATQMPDLSSESSVRFLNDLTNVSGGRKALRESILENLNVTRPNMSEKARKALAGKETNRILKTAQEAAQTEQKLNLAQNIQQQARSRGGDIDQLGRIDSYIKKLRTRESWDPQAADAITAAQKVRDQVVDRISTNEGISVADLTRTNAKGNYSLTKATRRELAGYRSDYRSDETGAGTEVKRQQAILAEQRKKLEGIRIGLSQDPDNKLAFQFKGPAGAYGADIKPPSRRDNNETLGKLLNNRAQEIFNILDPKGRGKNLTDAQKKSILDDQNIRLQKQYVDSVTAQIQQQYKIKDVETARLIALQKYEQALRTGASVVVQKNGSILDKAAADAGFTGKGQNFKNVFEGLKNSFKNAFTSQGGYFGFQTLGSYLGAGANAMAGSAETAAKTGGEDAFVATRTAGGALSGAAMGAAAGTAFLPGLGTAIGAAAGAVLGAAEAFKNAARDINEAKLAIALRETSTALSNFAKGTYNLTPQNVEKLQQQQTVADVQLSQKAAKDASVLGFGLIFSQDRYISELNKSMREAQAGQAVPMMDALTKILQDQAMSNVGNADMENTKARRRSFDQALNVSQGGIGSVLFSKIATATAQDQDLFRKKLFDMFQRTQEAEAIKRKQLTAETDINRSSAIFGGLSMAVDVATQRLSRMNSSLKNVTDFMDGSISSFSGTGLTEALQRPLGADRGDFMGAVRSITRTAGIQGGETENTAEAVTVAGRLLPGIINAVRSQPVVNLATGTDLSVQIGDMLRKGLSNSGVDPISSAAVTNMVSSQLGEEDFSKMLRETGQDMGKLIQKLLGPMAEPLKQSFSEIAKNLDERAKIFSDGLADLANRTRQTGELFDRAGSAQMAAFRNAMQIAVKNRQMPENTFDALSFNASMAFQQSRQERLTGFGGIGAQNPQFIASAMGGAFDEIRKAEERIAQATKGGNIAEQNAAATELASLKTRAANLGQALKNLTDVSERTSQAQEKLGKIQADKEGRQSLGLRYATAGAEGRTEIASSFRLLASAAKMGTAAPFTIRQQNQIFSLLSSLSPQMKLAGLGGVSVKDLTSQLLKTSFGGAFELDPQTAALEKALDQFVQTNYETAAEAARMQADIQQKLQQDFFSRLESGQQNFINELSRVMQDNQNLMRESLRMQAQSRLESLEKQVGQASMLGKIGVTNDEQFKSVSSSLKDPNNKFIDTIFEAGKNQNLAQTRFKNATDNTQKFVDDVIGVAGNSYARGTAKSDVAAILMNKFGEMGFSSPTDQQKLLTNFSESLDSRASYFSTLGGNRDNIAGAFRTAIESWRDQELSSANASMDSGITGLRSQKTIDENIINNIIRAAKDSSGNVTIKSLRESISAVESTNKKFSDLNTTLDQARQQVQNFGEVMVGKPQGKAQGGPIRYFNKGGWGSDGSLTPHGSDTVNARISPNEFVVSSGPAQRHKKLLERLNAGYADGGEVDPRKNLGSVQEVSRMSSDGILNPENTDKAIAQAQRIARVNAEVLFLSQLKNMNPYDRQKFLADQRSKLNSIAGKETFEQLGIKDAIAKIPLFFSDNKLADYHSSARDAAIGLALQNADFKRETSYGHLANIKKYHDQVIEKGSARQETLASINAEFKNKTGKTLKEFISNNPKLAKHNWVNDLNALSQKIDQESLKREFGAFRKDFVEKLDHPTILKQQLKTKREFGKMPSGREIVDLELLFRRYGGDPSALRTEAITEHLDKWYRATHEKLALTKTSDFVEDIQSVIGNGKERNVEKIIDEATKKVVNQKQQIEQINNLKDIAKKASGVRSQAFQTPDDAVAKILGDRSNLKFGRDQDANLMRLQLMSTEANAFNRLSPAIQSKLLEQKRQKIEQGNLTAIERDQLASSGLWNAINNNTDLTADEIKGYSESKSKMTLLQRAALEILMTKALANSKDKIEKDPDSLNAAEKAAYLIALDSQGRKEAFETFNDRNNAVLLTRLGQYISTNPGGIQKILSNAKDNGAAAYAKEAALLELVSAAFGSPTSLPKASEVYKDRSLRSKAQAEVKDISAKDVAGMVAAGMGAAANGLAGAAALAAPKVESAPPIFDVDEASKKLPGFASGGLVPGVGNTDSVRANLAVGSYVIRKSSVQKIGAENLAALPHLASGGVVPAMVMPGEHIFTPREAAKIGKSNLDHINNNGSLPGYGDGGIVINGVRYLPAGSEKWGGSRVGAMGFQPSTLKGGSNPMAPKDSSVQPIGEDQFLAIERINQAIGGAGGIVGLKARFFSLRNDLKNPRSRTKEKVAELRQLYATLTNPMVMQLDAQRQMMGAQEAFASFHQDPKNFISKARELRALAANAKASMEDRVAAKEQLNQMNYAASFINPRALQAAAKAQQKNVINGNDPLQGGLFRLDPALRNAKFLQAPQPKKEPAQGWTADDDIREARLAKQPKAERAPWKPFEPIFQKADEKIAQYKAGVEAEGQARYNQYYQESLSRVQKESQDRLNNNSLIVNKMRQLAQSPYVDQKQKDSVVKQFGFQNGGIVPGVGSGDRVPALLEPGELVVPKKNVQKFASGGIVGGGTTQGGPELLDVAAKFNQAAIQISQGLAGFSTSVSTFNGAVANFGTFVDKFDEAVGKIPGQIELSGANDISVNIMGQDSIVKAVTEALGPMIAQAIRDQQPVEQRAQ